MGTSEIISEISEEALGIYKIVSETSKMKKEISEKTLETSKKVLEISKIVSGTSKIVSGTSKKVLGTSEMILETSEEAILIFLNQTGCCNEPKYTHVYTMSISSNLNRIWKLISFLDFVD